MPILQSLCETEVDDLGDRLPIRQCDQYVTGLQVSMNDSLLMSVLGGSTGLHKQVEPFIGGESVPITVLSDRDSLHQFHREVRSSVSGDARVQNFGDVLMVHQRQSLPFCLESSQNFL